MESKSERIRRVRKAKKLSQGDVAKAVGVTRVAIGNWETDPTIQIGGEKLDRLAKVLSTSAQYILYGKDVATLERDPESILNDIKDGLFSLVIAGEISFRKGADPLESAKLIFRQIYGQDALPEEEPEHTLPEQQRAAG